MLSRFTWAKIVQTSGMGKFIFTFPHAVCLIRRYAKAVSLPCVASVPLAQFVRMPASGLLSRHFGASVWHRFAVLFPGVPAVRLVALAHLRRNRPLHAGWRRRRSRIRWKNLTSGRKNFSIRRKFYISNLEIYIFRLEMYISRLEMHIFRLEI